MVLGGLILAAQMAFPPNFNRKKIQVDSSNIYRVYYPNDKIYRHAREALTYQEAKEIAKKD